LHGRFSFVTTLWDLSTNRALVAIEGDELTRLRTPAMAAMVVGAAAARTGTLALFGAGHQGRAHLDALLSLVPFREVRLVDPQADLKALCQWLDSNHGVRAHACSGDEAVSGADVVVTTTRSKDPVFDGARLTPGATVIAMGSSIPTARELDDETLRRAARVGVEFRPQSLVEAGELVLGLESGALNPAKIHDLSDFFSGKAIWRRHGEEIVVFKSVGVGLADVATAAAVWRRWLERSASASHQVPSGAQATGS
jgi:ornithine cyclodeaminase